MAVTWSVTPQRVTIEGKSRHVRALLTTGAATQTVTAGGDNIPAFGSWGFKRNLDYLIISDAHNADGFIYKYEPGTPGQMRVYQGDNANAAAAPAVEATGVTINSRSLLVEAVGW